MNELGELWLELVFAANRVTNGPTADRRGAIRYLDGLVTAYAIITGESGAEIRERLGIRVSQ